VEKEREVRLHQKIEELVRSRVSLLEQDISRLQHEVNDSFTRLLERTDLAGQIPESDQLLGQIAAEVAAQVDNATAESIRLGADIALLRDSVAELDEQKTQAEVLSALVARAANFAPRVVLFVVKGTNALAWAARGLEENVSGSIRGLAVSLQYDTALRVALNSQQTYYGSPEEQGENNLIFDRLGNTRPHRVLAVPLKVRGKTAAVIYADSSDRGEKATNVEAIELLVHTTGMVVELVSLRARMAESAHTAARPVTPAASQSAPAASADSGDESARTSGFLQTPAPEAAPEPASAEQQQVAPAMESHQQAASSPTYFVPSFSGESQAPQQAADPPASMPAEAQGFAHQSAAPNASTSGSLSPDEQAHNAARRFARLLVSEIKLYNEQKVAEGRRNNDLYDRLKEDIDRSRQMYEKRVTPAVAARFDYFYDELVNTLAEGDPVKLGSDHPGPSVAM
jgi:hypothetical protein